MNSAIILQSSITTGDIANLFGAALLMVAAFHYLQYKNASSKAERRDARRKATGLAVIFAFYTYALTIYMPYSNTWTAQIGLSVDAYFNRLADKLLTLQQGTQSTSAGVTLIHGVRTFGLVMYVVLVSATAAIAKTPVLIYQHIRDILS